MDNFLTRMYEEEQEKVASADLQGLFDQFSVDELAAYLQLDKTAGIPGPDEAPMPAGVKGTKVIDKAELRKQRGEEVQKQVEKDVDQKEKESGCGVKHASARWADQMGRFLAQDIVKEAGFASMMAKGIGSKAVKGIAGTKGLSSAGVKAMKGMPSARSMVAGKGLAQRAAASAAKRSPFQSAASKLTSKARSLARPVAQRTSNLLRRI